MSLSEGSRRPRRARLFGAGSRRSLTLLGVGAASGLLIAGVGLFTAKGGAVRALPPEDAALVNGRPILRSDLIAQTEALYGLPFGRATPAQRRRVVGDMLREELFVQRGLELDLAASDPDVRTALVTGVERQVEADVTAQSPSDDRLRRFYTEHRADYAGEGSLQVIDLTPKTASDPAALTAAAAALRAGATARQVSDRYGLADARKVQGEEFYFAAKIHLGERLFAVARTLKPGQSAGPVGVGGTSHLLVAVKNDAPEPLRFEDARDRVQQDYAKAERARIEAGDLAYLRSKADILLAPEFR